MFDLVWMLEPTAWLGLLTLVVLEIVLGIDNLLFIAILAEKLPPELRDRARRMGLALALLMRMLLLVSISWLATLTNPMVHLFGHGFSGRDLILLIGGLFLLFKATRELHGRLEGEMEGEGDVIENARGTMVMNPKHQVLEMLSRRSMAITRLPLT